MPTAKNARSEYESANWEGGRSVRVKQKVIDGPNNLLDRRIYLRLTFEQIEHLYAIVQEAKPKLEADEKRVAAINAQYTDDE